MTVPDDAGHERHRWALIAENVDLGDGWSLAWCIHPNGDRWPFLVDRRLIGRLAPVPWGEAIAELAPHEALEP